LLEQHPSQCNIIPLPDSIRADSKAFVEFCDGLRENNYDLVVDLQGNARSWVVRRRIAKDYVKIRKETLRRLALIKLGVGKRRCSDIRRRFLRPLCRVGIDFRKDDDFPPTQLGYTGEELDAAREKFLSNFSDADLKHLVAIHPGSKWPLKQWSIEKFAQLIRELPKRGYKLLLLGEEFEIEPDNNIAYAFRTSLRELIALIASSAAFIGNDSGPLHIAEAVRTPAVGIFGPTHPALGYAPTGPGAKVLGVELKCRPCTLYGDNRCRLPEQLCMERISVDMVADAVDELVGEV